MRRFSVLLIVPAYVSAAAIAYAQEPAPAPSSDKPAVENADGQVKSEKKPAAQPVPAQAPSAPVPTPPAPVAPEEAEPPTPRLLAPVYAEDRYFGDGLGSETDVSLPRAGKLPALNFAIHGFFRAPMRVSRVKRTEVEAERLGGGEYNYRNPVLIDDNYYKSGFRYLPINERSWNETYFSVGNQRLTATIGLMADLFTDSSALSQARPQGIAQAWLTYRYKPVDNLSIRVKAGSFWDRFGHLPKYDTYIFGRTHQVGAQVRAEYQAGDFTFWALDGIGARPPDNNQIFTMVHYAHVGASYAQTIEVGGYYLKSSTRDSPDGMTTMKDSSMTIYGVDARLKTMAGKGYVAYSTLDASLVSWQAQAIEVMHSYGYDVMTNYLGDATNSNYGTGFLKNLAFQYDFSVADLYRGLNHTKASPLPWGGDITLSVFGLMSKVSSAQDMNLSDKSRPVNLDGVTKWKYGTEVGWRAAEWIGISTRFDRVLPDTADSAAGFRVLSPRLTLFTHFLTQEQIFFQFSRYWYKEAVTTKSLEGIPTGVLYPDEKVFKIQAQIAF